MPELSLFETNAATRVAVYDQIKSLQITRKLRRPSTLRLEIATQTPRYEMLTRGRYIGLSDLSTETINRVMRIDQLERSTESDSVIITGRDYAGWFDLRICVPPAGQSHHTFTDVRAETVVKTLVSWNAGPTAVAARVLPNLVIEADQARGQLVSAQARYQALSDMLEEVLTFDGGGYQIVYVPGPANMHRFEYISPVDRSQTVFLDLEFESVSMQQWIESDIDMRDSLYVAGQGEGVNRTIINRYLGGVARTGLNRREAFVDARDLNTAAALEDRGDSLLAQMAVDNRFAATLYERGSFRYGQHFQLGDIVTVQNRKWNMDVQARVVSATLNWAETEQPTVSLEIARPWPTIKERMSQEAYGISQVAPKGAVDYHSENHAMRHTIGSADALSPADIGAAAANHGHLLPAHAGTHGSAGSDSLTVTTGMVQANAITNGFISGGWGGQGTTQFVYLGAAAWSVNLAGGRYMLFFVCSVRNTVSGTLLDCHIEYDGSRIGGVAHTQSEPTNRSALAVAIGTVTLAAGTHTFRPLIGQNAGTSTVDNNGTLLILELKR